MCRARFMMLGLALLQALAAHCQPMPQSTEAATALSNMRLLVGPVATALRYEEDDAAGLITQGPLDSERGTIHGTQVRLRWTRLARKDEAVPSVLFELGLRREKGNSAYQGYLQAGASLQPYRARSSERFAGVDVRLGVPLAADGPVKLVPYARYGSERWERGLAQYSEHFHWRSSAIGALIQAHLTPRLQVEFDLALGRIADAGIEVPSLNFASHLPGRRQRQVGASLLQALGAGILVQCSALRETHAAGQSSADSAGIVEPPSRTRRTRLSIAFGYEY